MIAKSTLCRATYAAVTMDGIVTVAGSVNPTLGAMVTGARGISPQESHAQPRFAYWVAEA